MKGKPTQKKMKKFNRFTDDELITRNKAIVQMLEGNVNNEEFHGDFSGCKYDSEWDWLMPAVEKTELKHEGTYDFQTTYDANPDFPGWIPEVFTIFPKDAILGHMSLLRFETKIEAMYCAFSEFAIHINKEVK